MANLDNYYNRSADEIAKGYDRHMFRAGYVLQSAELNEIQDIAANRHKMLGDALFKDGDIVRDAQVVVDKLTGHVIAESGAVYLDGAVRGVAPATFTIPLTGTVVIGIYLLQSIITEVEDPSLKEPAIDVRAYGEPGAARIKIVPTWGIQGEGTDEFYPIYYVDDGDQRAKEPPPQLDSVTQAIAKYDRDSTGSSYIVSGLNVSQLDDLANGTLVYNVQDGRARVNGFGISLNTARRIEIPANPDLRYIDSEPHSSSTVAAQRINLDRTPINEITSVHISVQKTVSLSHGTFTGAQDPLPDTSIISIISCVQGATTYVKDVVYKLTAGKVDWSPSGAEPAPGSTYQVTYQFISQVTPTAIDSKGFTVTGAVVGSLVLTNYSVKLPRIDRLCMDETGLFVWIQGVATDYSPVRPQAPSNLLALCQVMQTWDSSRRLVADGVRMVPMSEIENFNSRLDNLTDLVAQQNLISDLGTRESAAKKGMFVDPFLDDAQRDQGTAQNAAVLGYALTLPINGDAISVSGDVTGATTCDFTLVSVLEQTSLTGDMKINPYMAFGIPAKPVTLTPAVDRWTVTQTSWLSDITQKFIVDNGIHDSYHYSLYGAGLAGYPSYTTSNTATSLVSSTTSNIEYLRQIDVVFEASGFGPGETLTELKFDGLVLAPVAV
ncbi:DUF4815 domain-containing protein [Pseudomonas sp.]|uniref:DUF4815 domain-containing protein n=1 Tax=Pseudomonas sp. TaxID=306 RepID=UPI003FD789DC